MGLWSYENNHDNSEIHITTTGSYITILYTRNWKVIHRILYTFYGIVVDVSINSYIMPSKRNIFFSHHFVSIIRL